MGCFMSEIPELKITQTQEWFINALLKLMKTKPFEEIQIKELAKKADLDRRTFYRYFKSKEDVLELYSGLIMQDFAKKILAKNELSLRTVVISYFEFWDEYIDFLKLLRESHMTYFFIERMDRLIYQYVSLKVKPYLIGQELSKETRYSFFFHFGGLWSMLNRWIAEEPRDTPEEMARIVVEVIYNGKNKDEVTESAL